MNANIMLLLHSRYLIEAHWEKNRKQEDGKKFHNIIMENRVIKEEWNGVGRRNKTYDK